MLTYNSTSFGMVVNSCKDAEAIDAANNLTTYTSESCLTDETEAESLIDQVVVYQKFLSQSSNPIFFAENGYMAPMFTNR